MLLCMLIDPWIECQMAGDCRMFTADAADCAQLLRHLAEQRGAAPNWRRQRPALMVEAAEFRPAADGGAGCGDAAGTLLLRCAAQARRPWRDRLRGATARHQCACSCDLQRQRVSRSKRRDDIDTTCATAPTARSGYVRERGLTANQLLHLPGAGDFQIDQLDGAPPPQAIGGAGAKAPRPNATGAGQLHVHGIRIARCALSACARVAGRWRGASGPATSARQMCC